MYRTFVLPMTSSYQSIWTLLVNAGYCDAQGNMLVSSAKNDAIIPDRVYALDVTPADVHAANTTYRDSQADPGTEQILTSISMRSSRNTICLKDYQFANGSNESLMVRIEAM